MRNEFNLLRYNIQDQIVEYIDRHGLAPGDPLPSERSLCKELDLNRTTFRTAIKELVNDGVLESVPGRGSFVAPPRVTLEMRQLSSLSTNLRKSGHTFARRMISVEIVEAKKKLAERLKIYIGTPVMALKRLAIVDGRPLIIEESYIPTQFCQGIWNYNLETDSLLDILQRDYGHRVQRHHGTILLRRASAFEAEHLRIQQGDPLFVEHGYSYNQEDEMIEYAVLNGTDRLEFAGHVTKAEVTGHD